MASPKVLSVLLLVVFAAVLSEARPNDVIVGTNKPGDYLLQREFVKKPSSLLQVVKLKKTFTGNNHGKFTQIRMLDQNKKGNGATATVLAGGPGESYITVEFKSIRGHSIDFIVEIYGR